MKRFFRPVALVALILVAVFRFGTNVGATELGSVVVAIFAIGLLVLAAVLQRGNNDFRVNVRYSRGVERASKQALWYGIACIPIGFIWFIVVAKRLGDAWSTVEYGMIPGLSLGVIGCGLVGFRLVVRLPAVIDSMNKKE